MFGHLLVPLDGSSLAECILPHVLGLSQAFGARVTLLQVLEQPHGAEGGLAIDPLDWRMRKAEIGAYLDGAASRLGKAGLEARHETAEGQAADSIIEYAHRHEVDLIALSSHGRSGLSGWNVSGVVQKIILRARTSVFLARAYRPTSPKLTSTRYERLMVTLDCSQRAEWVLPVASSLARFHDAQLLLAHVIPRPQMPSRAPLPREDLELAERVVERNEREAVRYFEHLRARLASEVPNVQHRLCVHEDTSSALHELVEQENTDLVVVSAHGHTGASRWPYGSVAVGFIAYGSTPLLVMQDLSPEDLESSSAELATMEYKGH